MVAPTSKLSPREEKGGLRLQDHPWLPMEASLGYMSLFQHERLVRFPGQGVGWVGR